MNTTVGDELFIRLLVFGGVRGACARRGEKRILLQEGYGAIHERGRSLHGEFVSLFGSVLPWLLVDDK